jgi:NosR/NirI family transcriptional regulator, nitrous oxide reductase regulator
VQDFIAGWTRKLGGEVRYIRGKRSKARFPMQMPASIDRPLRYAKYLVLPWVMIGSLYTVFPPLREFCPVRAVFSLKMTSLLWVTLIVFVAGSVLVERFWCKYFCPLGATLAIFNKISPVRLVADSNHCNNCGRCDIECSMGIQDVPGNLSNPECIRCLECFETCAREDAMVLKVFHRKE